MMSCPETGLRRKTGKNGKAETKIEKSCISRDSICFKEKAVQKIYRKA
jgi:hypothetical protein